MRTCFLALFVFIAQWSSAQWSALHAHEATAEIVGGDLLVYIQVEFVIGGGWDCPPMEWSTTGSSQDTLRINVVYNTYGTWQMFGCWSWDTITIGSYPGPACLVEVRFLDHQAVGELSSDTTLVGDPHLLSICTTEISSVNTEQVGIYPNPFTDRFTLTGLPEEQVTITLTDAVGRIAYQLSGMASALRHLELPALSNGPYVISIRSGSGTLSRKLIRSDQ